VGSQPEVDAEERLGPVQSEAADIRRLPGEP
jgi:hypothetical protein